MSEQSLVERAQAVVGDSDTIIAAAWFEPRGTAGGFVGGNQLGDMVGHAFGGNVGGLIGGVAGSVLGAETAKHTGDYNAGGAGTVHNVPWRSLVAVSARRIYAWRVSVDAHHIGSGDALFAYDRDSVAFTVHSRVSVHTFEVEDLRTSVKWEFEANRMGSHLKFLTDALHTDDG